jgi:hypothetical protein
MQALNVEPPERSYLIIHRSIPLATARGFALGGVLISRFYAAETPSANSFS